MSVFALAFAPFLLTGCAPDTDSSGNKAADTISGRAVSPSTSSRDGSVTARRVESDGSTSTASAEDAHLDDGVYVMELDGTASGALFLTATFDDGSTASVLVGADAAADGTLTAAPMSDETTAEAGIYSLRASIGVPDDDDSGAVLRAFVGMDVAEDWPGLDSDARTSVALGVSTAVYAWEVAGGTHTSAAVQTMADAMVDADVQADMDDEATSEAAGLATLTNAWTDAATSTADLSYMGAAALDAQLAVSGSGVSDQAVTGFLLDLRESYASAVISTAAADLEAGDVEPGTLNVTLLTSAALGGDLDGVLAQLVTTLRADQIAEVVVQAAVASDAAVAMNITIEAASDTDTGQVAAEAVATFRAAVEVDVAVNLMASGAFNQTEADAVASLLAQVYVTAAM